MLAGGYWFNSSRVHMRRVDCWDGKTLILRFKGPTFDADLAFVKALPVRDWVDSRHYWTTPARRDTFEAFIAHGWELSQNARESYEKLLNHVRPGVPRAVVSVTRLQDFLPYQVRAVEFLEAVHGRGILGDDMGLGKTIESLGYLLIHSEIRPAVVVCRATVKINWLREIRKWTGESALIISGRSEADALPPSPWYIINFDILGRDDRSAEDRKKHARKTSSNIGGWWRSLLNTKPKAVIADEVHYIAEPTTVRTAAFRALVRGGSLESLILLSGTLQRNRPKELYVPLNLVAPKDFSNQREFCERYCGPTDLVHYWKPKVRGRWLVTREYDGASNLDELNERMVPYMIRRRKADVLPELPSKTRSVVEMELDEPSLKVYAGAADDFLAWVAAHIERGVQAQRQIEILKQLAYLAKRNAVIQWIKDFLDVEDKLIVFAYHTRAVRDIQNEFPDISAVIEGATSVKDRQVAIDRFQNDATCRLFVGEIMAAGEGITLTAAHAVAMVELVWTAAVHEQAEDRAHRIGQKDNVLVYYLIAPGTVEDYIMKVLQTKFSTARAVLDGEDGEKFFGDPVREDITGSVVGSLLNDKHERRICDGVVG